MPPPQRLNYNTEFQKWQEKGEIKTGYIRKTNNPNMGRPRTNRNVRIELRLTEGENKLLEECSQRTGKTRTAVIVKGIAMVHKALEEK